MVSGTPLFIERSLAKYAGYLANVVAELNIAPDRIIFRLTAPVHYINTEGHDAETTRL